METRGLTTAKIIARIINGNHAKTKEAEMQIQQVKKEELMLLINGLRSTYVADIATLQARLLEQLEQELSTRFGCRLGEPA